MPKIKFLNDKEVKTLTDTMESASLLAKRRGKKVDVRNWAIIDTFLRTGLRASEIRNLKVGDLSIGHGKHELVVRDGKGGQDRTVWFSNELKNHLQEFIEWKRIIGESVDDDAPLFVSGQDGHLSKAGLYQAVKTCMRSAELPGYSPHSLRHTFATHLFEKTKNIRLVQRQLGHKNLKTTMIYADVVDMEKMSIEDPYKEEENNND